MSIKLIPAFHDIRLPQKDGIGWFTFDINDCGMYYLLNKGRPHLCDLDEVDSKEITDNLYFDTEVDCHKAAAEYYDSYGKVYPYTAEWLAARKIQPAIKKSSTNEVHSQVMVFE